MLGPKLLQLIEICLYVFIAELGEWTKEKAEALKSELYALKNYILNLDPETLLASVQKFEFEQLKEREDDEFINKAAFIKFMKSLSGYMTDKGIVFEDQEF